MTKLTYFGNSSAPAPPSFVKKSTIVPLKRKNASKKSVNPTTTEKQGALQKNINEPNLLGLKGFRLDEKGRDDAHSHPDIGGDGALDTLSCYDAHDAIFQKSNIPLRSVSARSPHIPRKP